MVNHDRDWLYLTKDLGVPLPLWEYDLLSRKRISRIMKIQEKRLEQEKEMKEQQVKEAERRAKNANRHSSKAQRMPV